MIEFFHCSSLINPQIEFLLRLQEVRNSLDSSIVNDFFLLITTLGEFIIPTIICSTIYWCFDVVLGVYLFSLFTTNLIVAQLFKMLACVYRPWILSDKIQPLEKALRLASGYSFPSGHSVTTTSIFGGLAYILKHKIFSSFLLLVIFCVMFSRMWLGVHTPQDVIVGFLTGLVLVFSLKPFIDWCEADKNRYLYCLIFLNVIAIMCLMFICFKNYPADYINGMLIVNPRTSIYAAVFCYAYALGLADGFLICRKFFPFDTNISFKNKIFRAIFGLLLLFIVFYLMNTYLWGHSYSYKFVFCTIFTLGLVITAGYPAIFMAAEKFFKIRHN